MENISVSSPEEEIVLQGILNLKYNTVIPDFQLHHLVAYSYWLPWKVIWDQVQIQ